MTCENCKTEVNAIVIHDHALWCWPCHNATKGQVNLAPAVIPDEIPGGQLMRHGICWPDGSPRTFYSRSAIRQAAFEAGYSQGDDTPKINQRLIDERGERAYAKRH